MAEPWREGAQNRERTGCYAKPRTEEDQPLLESIREWGWKLLILFCTQFCAKNKMSPFTFSFLIVQPPNVGNEANCSLFVIFCLLPSQNFNAEGEGEEDIDIEI